MPAVGGAWARLRARGRGHALDPADSAEQGPALRPTPANGPDPYGDPDPEWLRIDWREHLRRVEVAGTRVNYVELGSGPPVVLVHGLAGCWQNWLENIPHLARDHRVLALDLPGFGASPIPSWEISIDAYGRLLHDFCERLGVGACTVIGNSMGGFIATELGVSEPERVSRLVLAAPAGVTWAQGRREVAALIGRAAGAAAPLLSRYQLAGLGRRRLRQRAYGRAFWNPRELRPELLWEQTAGALHSPGFHQALISMVGYDTRELLGEIEVPTLVVWGLQDRIVPPRAAPVYERLIGDNASLVLFDRCGHLPQLERPVRFNRLADGFLTGSEPG